VKRLNDALKAVKEALSEAVVEAEALEQRGACLHLYDAQNMVDDAQNELVTEA
jgi:hypothetical protein